MAVEIEEAVVERGGGGGGRGRDGGGRGGGGGREGSFFFVIIRSSSSLSLLLFLNRGRTSTSANQRMRSSVVVFARTNKLTRTMLLRNLEFCHHQYKINEEQFIHSFFN